MSQLVTDALDPPQQRCVLRNRAFNVFDNVVFRRSATDGRAVMKVMLGDREALVPLRSLQRAFAIEDDSADGRMLGLIEQSLDFVCGLELGDALPREVLDGGASWEPGPVHRDRAQARLSRGLIAWLDREVGPVGKLDHHSVAGLVDDTRLRQRMNEALDHAARILDLPDRASVVKRFEELGEEFSYIEALRERLLDRVKRLCERLASLQAGFRGDGDRAETLTQVRRLAGISLRQITCRFEDVDAQTKEIVMALGDGANQRGFIRSNRDWLYSNLRGWEPILLEWSTVGFGLEDRTWAAISKTYHFLAQRYMPVQEWHSIHANSSRRKSPKAIPMMQW
jgi:hypothetical protein